MKIPRRFLALLLVLLFTMAAAQEPASIPPLKTRVTDLAGMLTPAQRASLESKLQAHETQTSNQVAVLIVPNTGPEPIEQYGIRVAEAWKIGRKGVDDGVILIIAKETRKIRLEVGRGAEGVIPDAYAKRIVQDVIAPRFRQNDFYGGLDDGITTIHALLNKEAFPPPKKEVRSSRKTSGFNGNLLLIVVIFFIVARVASTLHRARRSSGDDWGRPASGIFIGGGGWGSGGSDGGGGDFGGGGGDFGGGGASGDW